MPKILVTCFSHCRLLVTFFYSLSVAYLRPCSSPPLPRSSGAHICKHTRGERCSGKIRGGGMALRCAPPYFDHWNSAFQLVSIYSNNKITNMTLLHLHHNCGLNIQPKTFGQRSWYDRFHTKPCLNT